MTVIIHHCVLFDVQRYQQPDVGVFAPTPGASMYIYMYVYYIIPGVTL